MSQESFCCEVWCRLFYGRHYNNTDQWPKDKLEWPKKERIKTGKLLGSCSPFIYLTSRTSKYHVMPLWMHLYSCSFYEEKTIFPRHYSLWLREVLLRMKMICHSNAMVSYKVYFDIRKTTGNFEEDNLNMFCKLFNIFIKWIVYQSREDKWGLDKWMKKAHSPLEAAFNCVSSRDFEPLPISLVNLNVTFMLNQAKPISIQSGEYRSCCCIIMDSS